MAHIDWLSYTVRKLCETPDDVLKVLPYVLPEELAKDMFPIDLDNFSTSTMEYDLRSGRFRYNYCMRFSNGVDVLFQPSLACEYNIREKMGFHVVLSGSVLKSFVSVFDEVQCAVWIDSMNNSVYDWKVSRCDIAYDTFDVTMDEIKQKLVVGEYCTRCDITMMTKLRKYNEHLETVYIGNRKSERFMRIYDKRIEQGLPVEECSNWVRMEMEFHDDSCIDALDCFCNGTIGGLFLGFFRFLEDLSDSNRCRNEVWSKMADIISFKEIVRVSKARESSSDAFLKKVCIPMLLAYYQENPTLVINEVNRATASPSVVFRLKREKQELGKYFSQRNISDRRYFDLMQDDAPFQNKLADLNIYEQLGLMEA